VSRRQNPCLSTTARQSRAEKENKKRNGRHRRMKIPGPAERRKRGKRKPRDARAKNQKDLRRINIFNKFATQSR
ncbi:MAG: hypothetical protein K2O33_07840, partial [Muribaculaceae bacterium]|nr:hypothetical protein [Muribaculaceae bacterium]